MKRLCALALVLLSSGCATGYVGRTARMREAYEHYDYPQALGRLMLARRHDRGDTDRLLFLLDRAMILHAAGRWAESADAFVKADRLADALDRISVHQEAASLVADSGGKPFEAADYERLLAHVFAALDDALAGRREDALVEVRKADDLLWRMQGDGAPSWRALAIAGYLGGVLHEADGDDDGAYLDYASALRTAPDLAVLAAPALRLARRTGRDDEARTLEKAHPSIHAAPLPPGSGQVVVIVEAGRAPRRVQTSKSVPGPRGVESIPVSVDQRRTWARASTRVTVGAVPRAAVTVTSLEGATARAIADGMAVAIARAGASRLVGTGLVAAVARITTDPGINGLVRFLVGLGRHVDLRAWLSLPAEIRVARFVLPAGRHPVHVDWRGRPYDGTVVVKPGGIALVVVRRY